MQNTDTFMNIIKAVKNHPKLFKNYSQNNDDDLREWTAVAAECKMTISEAQVQWNSLLIKYIEYLRSNQHFDLAQYMDFLQPYFFTINDVDAIDEDDLLNAIETKKLDKTRGPNESHMKIEEETFQKTLDLKNTKITTKIKMPSTACDQQIQPAAAESNIKNSYLNNFSSLELIFLGYAKQLQKMPLSLQLKTKRKIADIMDETELQIIS